MLVHVPGIRVEKPSTSSKVLVLPAQEQGGVAEPSESVTGTGVRVVGGEEGPPQMPKVSYLHCCAHF